MTSKIVSDVSDDVTEILEYGDQVRIKLFTGSVSNAEWDDAQALTQSGTDIWTSGVNLPINSREGSKEAVLLEQGKLKMNDTKLYIKGNIETGPIMRIGLGSPVGEEYSVIPNGVIALPPYGTPAYKQIFLRYISSGSLAGE